MKRLSFSTQIATLWAMVAAICTMLVAVVWLMAASAESQQAAGAKRQAATACTKVASRYSLSQPLSATAGAAANTDLMYAVLDTVLAQAPGVEGGFWTSGPNASGSLPGPGSGADSGSTARNAAQRQFLAYAFPTYQGSGIKRDIPQAETPLILRTLGAAAVAHAAAADVIRSGQDAVIAAACPVPGAAALFVWTLTRARPPLGPSPELLAAGLAAVLAVVLIAAVALVLALKRWRRMLAQLERALSAEPEAGLGPAQPLPHPGEPELDSIVDALNEYAQRAERFRQQTLDLGAKLASAERFGMLGKLAAQVAHEIRNPAGAMRLKAENALAGDDERQRSALRFILEQIGRIEGQIASLLALTQPITVKPHAVDVSAWLARIVESHRELARQRGIRLELTTSLEGPAAASAPEHPAFDGDQLQRALDNLLLNALRHVGEKGSGSITVSAEREEAGASGRPYLRIAVFDNGPGVPRDQRERIFEPFVTGRPDGSGLGLAVVREVASAHGGEAWLDDNASGARFVIDIPWRPS